MYVISALNIEDLDVITGLNYIQGSLNRNNEFLGINR
jgi:hypothetical protein